MKALLINVPQDAADRFFAGQTNHLPCSQIPDLAHVLKPYVYICCGEDVLGTGEYEDAAVERAPFVNSKTDRYGYNVAWCVSHKCKYRHPKSIKDLGVKRSPEEWRWVRPKCT